MTVTLHYTEAILRQAIFHFLWRAHVKRMLLPFVFMLVVVALAYYSGSVWLQAFTILSATFAPAMVALAYGLRIKESLKRFSMLDHGQLVLTVNDSGVFSQSAISKSETPWKLYTDLWEFPECYLFFYGSSQFITLPKNQVTPEFIEIIRSKLPSVVAARDKV